MKYKGGLTLENIGQNPFVVPLRVPVKGRESGFKKDADGIWMPNEIDMDKQPYYKAFYSKELREIQCGLSYRALQMWMWIMQTIRSGDDVLQINPERYCKECRIKAHRTFRAATVELCRYGFIAPSMACKNVYFINPAYSFKGSRIAKYPHNIVNI